MVLNPFILLLPVLSIDKRIESNRSFEEEVWSSYVDYSPSHNLKNELTTQIVLEKTSIPHFKELIKRNEMNMMVTIGNSVFY